MSLEGKSPQEIADMAAALDLITSNPATRQMALTAMKRANPALQIPEIDIPAQVNASLAAGFKRLDAAEAELANRKVEQDIRDKRQHLIDQGLATKADLPEIEKFMTDNNIASHELAAKHIRMSKELAPPTPAQTNESREYQMPTMDLKPFRGDMSKWARETARQAIDEVRGRSKIAVS